MSDLGQQMNEMGARARAAASVLAYASPEAKTKALLTAADAMVAATDHIISENAKDLDFGREKGLTDAMMDRLMLDADRIAAMAQGCAPLRGRTILWGKLSQNGIDPRAFISVVCALPLA